MKLIKVFRLLILFGICVLSCDKNNPNNETKNVLSDRQSEINSAKIDSGTINKKVYVPIYSDIYNRSKDTKVLLTATLSIRNTSETDTLYIGRVDYYNTEGNLVRKYIESSIYLKPMESIAYVIEEDDDVGGVGANFMLEWYANKPIQPLFQAVMMSGLGNKAFSFTTEGFEVE